MWSTMWPFASVQSEDPNPSLVAAGIMAPADMVPDVTPVPLSPISDGFVRQDTSNSSTKVANSLSTPDNRVEPPTEPNHKTRRYVKISLFVFLHSRH
jgi:hypothetical protein